MRTVIYMSDIILTGINYKDDKLDRRDKIILALWIVGILCIAAFALIGTASAQTITFSAPGALTERDIAVYFPNQSMVGLYNSTSTITLDGNYSYIFVITPVASNPLEDPTSWLQNTAFPFVQSNVIGLIIIVFLIVMWWRR